MGPIGTEGLLSSGCLALGPLLFEEVLEKSAALVGTDPPHHFHGVVEPRVIAQRIQGSDSPGLRVGCPVDESAEPGIDQGTGTHGARFERDCQCAIGQPPFAEPLGSRPDGDDLGMSRGIAIALTKIKAFGDNLIPAIDDGTDRDLVALGSLVREHDGMLHHLMVNVAGARRSRI